MAEQTVFHDTFNIERQLSAPPALVFQAFADPQAKAKWFVGPPGWKSLQREMDFRIGGREIAKGAFPNGMVTEFDCRYFDIVPEQRIVYGYEMQLNGKRISVSLATILFESAQGGTKVSFTEQGVYFTDAGYGTGAEMAASRLQGSEQLLDKVAATLG
jgi:uncharacterized protein YndB with AHSA1/START domain